MSKPKAANQKPKAKAAPARAKARAAPARSKPNAKASAAPARSKPSAKARAAPARSKPRAKPASASNAPWRVFTARGWGSAIAEAVLTVAGIAYEREDVDPAESGPARDRLRAANPLGQLPTVVLPDGTVLTESAAIVLRAADLAPRSGLVPAPDDPERTAFLRWLVFLVAAVYPTFTYGDDPKRWVKIASDELRRSTDEHRKTLWKQLDGVASAPWFLGARFSALDIYVAVMTRWRPQRAWFAKECPRLHTIALAVDERPDLAPILTANFGE